VKRGEIGRIPGEQRKNPVCRKTSLETRRGKEKKMEVQDDRSCGRYSLKSREEDEGGNRKKSQSKEESLLIYRSAF